MSSESDPHTSIKHDLRVPYATLWGCISMLKDEPDMSPADRNQFLEILEREIHTCESQATDLHALILSGSQLHAMDGTESIDTSTFIREVRDEFMTHRSLPSELDLLTRYRPLLNCRVISVCGKCSR